MPESIHNSPNECVPKMPISFRLALDTSVTHCPETESETIPTSLDIDPFQSCLNHLEFDFIMDSYISDLNASFDFPTNTDGDLSMDNLSTHILIPHSI